VNRATLKQLAHERIEDARILLDQGRWSAAYYLAGYAIEAALKACILKFVDETGVIFTDRRFAEKCWTHSIEFLMTHADLMPQFGQDIGVNAALRGNWGLVLLWSETCRYQSKSESEARSLIHALTYDPDGIFLWIQRHW
jgi:hypothetical protein